MTEPERVAVVGGGAVGVTAAAELAGAGVDVTLYERGEIAAESTGRAAGICYDAFADRRDARIAARALERFRALAAETDFAFTDRPYVWLAREGDEASADAIREQVPRMVEHGRDVALLDPADLAGAFPALRTDDVAVAAIARDAGLADPVDYARTMADRAETAGVTIRTGTPVEVTAEPAVVTPSGPRAFDAVLVAAGAHTRSLLADAGVPIPVKAYRVQALVTDELAAADGAPALYDATGGWYARPKAGGFLVGDGTQARDFDPDEWDRSADAEFVADATASLRDALAAEAEVPAEPRRAWA